MDLESYNLPFLESFCASLLETERKTYETRSSICYLIISLQPLNDIDKCGSTVEFSFKSASLKQIKTIMFTPLTNTTKYQLSRSESHTAPVLKYLHSVKPRTKEVTSITDPYRKVHFTKFAAQNETNILSISTKCSSLGN